MKIKHENGMVTFIMRTGNSLVRSQMPIGSAMGIVNNGKTVTEKNGQIIVDDTYFFPAVAVPKSRKKQTECDSE